MNESEAIIKAMNGVPIDKHSAPFYHRATEKLSALAGISKPKIYIVPEDIPNAFAVGLSGDDASIAVTTGLLRHLNEDEIESALAHEIGHIKKGHMVDKTKVAMKALAVTATGEIAGTLIMTSDIDFTPGDGDSYDPLSVGLKIVTGLVVAGAGAALGSKWLTDVSFKSEFEADRFSASLTKKSWALARALKKLENLTKIGSIKYRPEVSQLFIVCPSYLNYKTHPPTEERVKELLSVPGDSSIQDISSIFCPTCGNKTDGDGKYCYWCGNLLET